MPWDDWVIDATMGYPFCFCPIDNGDIVTGMNLLGGLPPGARLIGVVHADGDEAADRFYQQHKIEIDGMLPKGNVDHQ